MHYGSVLNQTLNSDDLQKILRSAEEKYEEIREILDFESDRVKLEQPSHSENGLDTFHIEVGAPIRARCASQQALLEALGKAIENIKSGSYSGICTGCHNPIPVQRLIAVPQTKHCMKCKKK